MLSAVQESFVAAIRSPPPEVIAARRRLVERAEHLASKFEANAAAACGDAGANLPAELDVVVAGSGFLSNYFLGVYSIVSRLSTKLVRFSGASSGAQTAFQCLLTGEDEAIDSHLCYGHLHGRESIVRQMYTSDRCWKAVASDVVSRHANNLPALDGRMFVSVTQLRLPRPKNVLYSDFSASPTLAAEVFYATGAPMCTCDGHWPCTDGGATLNEPRFADGARPMLLVRPTKSGLPLRMAVGFDMEQGVRAIEAGQDAAAAFFAEYAGIHADAAQLGRAPAHASAAGALQVTFA